MYERDFLLKFQKVPCFFSIPLEAEHGDRYEITAHLFVCQVYQERPPGLPPIEVILGNEDKRVSSGRGGKPPVRLASSAESWSRVQQSGAGRARGAGMPPYKAGGCSYPLLR